MGRKKKEILNNVTEFGLSLVFGVVVGGITDNVGIGVICQMLMLLLWAVKDLKGEKT